METFLVYARHSKKSRHERWAMRCSDLELARLGMNSLTTVVWKDAARGTASSRNPIFGVYLGRRARENCTKIRDRPVRHSRLPRLATAFVVVALTLCGSSTSSQARTIEVGPGKPFALPSQAAVIAKDGDHIEIAAGTYVDCAVWAANDLVIEG